MLQGGMIGTARAQALRQDMSLPEVILWAALRRRPAGLKFRRQHPAGPFVADFYCHAARLIIEVDGEAHNRGDRPSRDRARDQWFALRGLAVLRLAAQDVLSDSDGAVRGIVDLATNRMKDQE